MNMNIQQSFLMDFFILRSINHRTHHSITIQSVRSRSDIVRNVPHALYPSVYTGISIASKNGWIIDAICMSRKYQPTLLSTHNATTAHAQCERFQTHDSNHTTPSIPHSINAGLWVSHHTDRSTHTSIGLVYECFMPISTRCTLLNTTTTPRSCLR